MKLKVANLQFYIPSDIDNTVFTAPNEPSNGETSYVLPTPSRLLPVNPCPRMAKLKALLGKKVSEPVSDGFLGRNISVRRRDRAGSAPVISNEVSHPQFQLAGESDYVSVLNSDSDYKLNKGGKANPKLRRGSSATSGSNSSVPVINLENCDEDGCKFVKKL